MIDMSISDVCVQRRRPGLEDEMIQGSNEHAEPST